MPSVSPQRSFLKKVKFPSFAGGLLILLFTLLVFFLDVATGEKTPFHIFYFPSIMLMTWYFGKNAGRWMVGLATLMWFLAEWDTGHFKNPVIFWQNGIIYACTFFVIFQMIEIIHEKVAQLEEASQELARSNLELERFASRAAHDLQSPLVTLLGYTELLQEKHKNAGDAETNDFIEHILKSVRRMSAFIKALLEYARVLKPEEILSPVDLNGVMTEVLETHQFTIQQKKARITFDPLPSVQVNPVLAGLLFQNLIGNAMKYCEKEPQVHIGAEEKDNKWLFSVRDNGIGIPQESRERIFVMFEKLITQSQYPGSGIGLATCQKIVERYGGRIWVESKLGEGSTFFFTLPIG